MWAISQGNPTTEIAYFERMGLDGLFSNPLILTRKQAIGRKRREQLVGACPLSHSCFLTLYFFFFLVSMLSFFFLIFCLLSYLLFFVLSLMLASPFTVQSQGFFILPVVMGFTVLPLNYFCPSVGGFPRPPTDLSTTQPSPLPFAGHTTFHS